MQGFQGGKHSDSCCWGLGERDSGEAAAATQADAGGCRQAPRLCCQAASDWCAFKAPPARPHTTAA